MELRRGCALFTLSSALVPALTWVTGSLTLLRGQAQGGADPPTVRVQSRLVIEDVLVMDGRGNPIRGLPASSFHVSDNGVPQNLLDFEEGSPKLATEPVATSLPAGTFTNAARNGLAPTTEILLVDTDDIGLTDQMFLGAQLRQSLAQMPQNLPVTIFSVRNGRVVPVLTGTTDREAMVRAVGEILPVQNHAIDDKFQSAVNQLMTVAAFLQQTPGRKNLLWFSGEYPLVSVPAGVQVAGGTQVNYTARDNIIHQVQEAMAESRISVYPVDVRGVLETGTLIAEASGAGALAGDRNPRAVNAASQQQEVAAPDGATPADQRGQMRSLAQATGGRAYMLNDLSEEINQAFDLGRSAYMLAYRPSPYSTDQSFHNVLVRVDGGYSVSYRTGYLATFTGAEDETPRVRLTADGAKAADPIQSKPMVFQVQLSPHGDLQHVTLAFSIDLAELKQEHTRGLWSSRLLVSTYAYDPSGKVRDGKVQQLDTDLSEEQYSKALQEKKRVATKQEVTVPKSAKYLMVVVRDRNSQRVGSLVLQTRLLASLSPTITASAVAAKPQSSSAAP